MLITSASIFVAILMGGVSLGFIVGAVVLQIFLSKKDNKWLGLILPTICLLFSLIAVLSIPVYTHGELTLQEILPDGRVVEQIVEQEAKPVTDTASVVFQIIVVFLLYNIPTVVLMLIYAGYRQKNKKNREIVKMNIQDLE